MSALFHPYLCGREAAEWLINMSKKNQNRKDGIVGLFKWAISLAWNLSTGSFLLWGGVSVVGATMPFLILRLTQQLIDGILEQFESNMGRFEYIVILIVVLIGAYIVQMVYNTLSEYMKDLLLMIFAPRMQKHILKKTRKLSLRTTEKQEFAEKYAQIEYNINKITYFVGAFIQFIAAFITVVTMIVLAITVGWYFGLVAAILVAIRFFIYKKIVKREYGFYSKLSRIFRRQEYYYSIISDLSLAREVRQLSMIPFVKKRWSDNLSEYYNMLNGIKVKNAAEELKVSLIDSVFTAGIMLIAAIMLRDQTITVGTMVMVTQMVGTIIGYLSTAGNRFGSLSSNLSQIEVQKQLLDLCDSETERPPLKLSEEIRQQTTVDAQKVHTVFELKNVSFRYTDDTPLVLDSIDLKIKHGEIVALVGENGSGKSTLTKIMLGLYKPTSGEMLFCEKPCDQLAMSDLNQNVGVVMQNYVMYRYGFRENIGFSLWTEMGNDEALLRAAENGDALDIINKQGRGNLDKLLARWFNNDAVDLSVGQNQRVAVSRAYLGDRPVMVMDEPASALDPIAEYKQFEKMRERSLDNTAILISHRVGFARLADRIIVLDGGKIVEEGNHNELMAKNCVYAELFRAQAQWYTKEQIENYDEVTGED